MRRINGFLALHKGSKRVLWVYSELDTVRQAVGSLALPLCPDPATPWPPSDCGMFGFHGLQEVAPNDFWVFANCDASGRAFRIDPGRRCLLPRRHYALPEFWPHRATKGSVYPLPWGVLVGHSPHFRGIWNWTDPSAARLIRQPNTVWSDPALLAPFVELSRDPRGVRVRLAHHLWVSEAVTGLLRCVAVPEGALPCGSGRRALVLGPWMATTEVWLPVEGNATRFKVTVSVWVNSGAVTNLTRTFGNVSDVAG